MPPDDSFLNLADLVADNHARSAAFSRTKAFLVFFSMVMRDVFPDFSASMDLCHVQFFCAPSVILFSRTHAPKLASPRSSIFSSGVRSGTCVGVVLK